MIGAHELLIGIVGREFRIIWQAALTPSGPCFLFTWAYGYVRVLALLAIYAGLMVRLYSEEGLLYLDFVEGKRCQGW